MPRKKTADPKPPGRPRKEIDVKVLRALASIGATEEEICAGLAASGTQLDLRTLKRRLQEPAYREVWDLGRNKFKLSIRRLQFQHAHLKNSAGVTMTIHMSKHHLGETEKSLVELTGKNGGPISTVDLTKATDEQLKALEAIFGPLAESGSDDAGDQGGENAASSAG